MPLDRPILGVAKRLGKDFDSVCKVRTRVQHSVQLGRHYPGWKLAAHGHSPRWAVAQPHLCGSSKKDSSNPKWSRGFDSMYRAI